MLELKNDLPMTAGAKALMRILSCSSLRAKERTSPITPDLVLAYNGATGKG
jgi:hypothetical protein